MAAPYSASPRDETIEAQSLNYSGEADPLKGRLRSLCWRGPRKLVRARPKTDGNDGHMVPSNPLLTILGDIQSEQRGVNQMRILLIEDEKATAHSIELALKFNNFAVDTASVGEDGVQLGKSNEYDIILLDLNLPDMSGFEVLRSLRISKVRSPVLILSGRSGVDDKVTGFCCGADDYLTKPFHKDELLARIHAVIRRSKGLAQSVISTGDLCVNLDTKMAAISGVPVHLTRKEYQMLEFLSLRKGSTLSKATFLNNLYGGVDEPSTKIIDVFMCKLRKKLSGAANGKNYIETVRGRGYVLRESNQEQPNFFS